MTGSTRSNPPSPVRTRFARPCALLRKGSGEVRTHARRALHQQRRDAAGAPAHGEHPVPGCGRCALRRPRRRPPRAAPASHRRRRHASSRPTAGRAMASMSLPGRCTISTTRSPQRKNISRPQSGCERSNRHVEPEPRAIQRRGAFGIAGRDHDMVHRGDRGDLGAHRQRALLRQFEEEHPHPARGIGRRARSAATTAWRPMRRRGFRPRRPVRASAPAGRAGDASWRCRRSRKQRLASPSPCSCRSPRGCGRRSAPSPDGAINSSVMLSSVNSTRSAPSPLLRHAGVRANRVSYAASAAAISRTRMTT